MGLSASQARLLSITARLTHNETQSQLITNAKLRLSDKSSEASAEYMDALNATKFIYMNYDTTGTRQTQDMTVGAVYQYSDIKNQYGFVDAQGRLLVSATDAANFEKSNELAKFLECYGIGGMDNPQYERALQDIYGENYANFYDENDPQKWLTTVNGATSGVVSQMATINNGQTTFSNALLSDEAAYNAWVQSLNDSVKNIDFGGLKTEGLLNTYVDSITDVPDYIPEPTAPGNKPIEPEKPDFPDFSALATSYNSSTCYSAVSTSSGGIGHMEHNLSALIWGEGGVGENTLSITNSDGSITVTRNADINYSYVSLTNYSFSDTTASKNLSAALNEYSEYATVQNIQQTLTDLYCDVVNYLDSSGNVGTSSTTDLQTGRYTINSTAAAKSESELVAQWKNFYEQLASLNDLQQELEDQWYQEKWLPYEQELKAWEQEYEQYVILHDEWERQFLNQLKSWSEKMQTAKQAYTDAINNLPAKEIPDENDPKYQWYTNLWFRMGGISEAQKDETQNNYKVLEDFYMYNADWLKFALEHGIVRMEQVQYQEEGETFNEKMNQYAWTSIPYGTCADMYEESDDFAIAKAEAEYQQKTAEIQAKDKKYDNDLKKLDTTHNSLQTEYDSIKSVIEKNVERSFKAFS